VAKHRTSTRRTARKVALGAMAAFGLSGSLVLGHATSTTAMVQLTNTVIGIGGKDDATSSGLPTKLSGTVIPKVGDYGYFGVHYPATFELDKSRDAAVPVGTPLPGAFARSALPALERRLADGRLALVDALDDLDVAEVELDPRLVADADTPEELARLLVR